VTSAAGRYARSTATILVVAGTPRTARIVRFTCLLPEYEDLVQALAAEVRSGKLHVWLSHLPAGDLLLWYIKHDVGARYAFDRESILNSYPSTLVNGLERRFNDDILDKLRRQPHSSDDVPGPGISHPEFAEIWKRTLHRGF